MAHGQVKNHSSKTLWVVETDTHHAIAHKLAPGRQSSISVDADGFRAVDGTPVDGHTSWVKINDFSTADVADQGAALTRGCVICWNVQDNEFGDVTFDSAEGWGEPIGTPLLHTTRTMSAGDLVRALRKPHAQSTIAQGGMVKLAEHNENVILFSPGNDCGKWVRVPVDEIEAVDYEGSIICKDHQHPYVRLHLKAPPNSDSKAALFAGLLSGEGGIVQAANDRGDFALSEHALATQRIDIQFQANGNGTLNCGAGSFPCLGRPGLAYPRDITITTADKQGTHYSTEFHVWMPYSILIWGQRGIYIHEWPFCQATGGASAGCIHLCPGHAATVYNWIVGRTRITIRYPW